MFLEGTIEAQVLCGVFMDLRQTAALPLFSVQVQKQATWRRRVPQKCTYRTNSFIKFFSSQ